MSVLSFACDDMDVSGSSGGMLLLAYDDTHPAGCFGMALAMAVMLCAGRLHVGGR